MTNTNNKGLVLWGFKGEGPAVYAMPIALTGGSLRHINAEKRMRAGEGWTFGVYAEGTAPAGLRLQAEAAAQKRAG
jgi:hypothetical protein